MKYADLRDFLRQLESLGELKRIAVEVSPRLEMTEFCDRMLKNGGPAILFERPTGHSIPVLGNLFGTVRRVALAMGAEDALALREIGKLLAALREPEAPRGLREVWERLPELRHMLSDVERGIWQPHEPAAAEPPKEVPTFHEFASKWLEARRKELRPNTVADYTWRLSDHLLPFFAKHRLSAITVEEVDRYRAVKVRRGAGS